MKKLDKLVLKSFFGPFFLTFTVVVFVFLMMHLLKSFDEVLGKDLGIGVWSSLLGYLAIYMFPNAMPLAVLLASLMTFGNLSEHFELTAVKSLGISMVRIIAPIFVVVILFTGLSFFFNNYLVPKAALEAYSLLWDLKKKKPALDLKEGVFYYGLPDITIKVNKKYPDGVTLGGIIIYDHRARAGNKEVTVADSGKMSMVMDESYLRLELFKGYNYNEGSAASDLSTTEAKSSAQKVKFDKSVAMFDLSSFAIQRTDRRWFQNNRNMRNLQQLRQDLDSLKRMRDLEMLAYYENSKSLNRTIKMYVQPSPRIQAIRRLRDSIQKSKDSLYQPMPEPTPPLPLRSFSKRDSAKIDSLYRTPYEMTDVLSAITQARYAKDQTMGDKSKIEGYKNDYIIFDIQWHKILANTFACLAMFLIGAPLGSIIKKGGIGFPVVISVLFFILFYVMNMFGEKYAKLESVSTWLSVWSADIVLLLIGLFFLLQSWRDARIFEADAYVALWKLGKDRIVKIFSPRKTVTP